MFVIFFFGGGGGVLLPYAGICKFVLLVSLFKKVLLIITTLRNWCNVV